MPGMRCWMCGSGYFIRRSVLRSTALLLTIIALLLALVPVSGAEKPTKPLWSLKPVSRPALPECDSPLTNPIDRFLTVERNEKGLKPVGPADKLTLLRRVYLDLLGLPPTVAEQDAFLADTSPDAYDKVVER